MNTACPVCGEAVVGHRLKVTCSPECKAKYRRAYKQDWRSQNAFKERERLREYERRQRRKRSPEAMEKRRIALRERYARMRTAELALKQCGIDF